LISREEYSGLSLNQKGDILFAKGDYIAVRDYYNYKVQLYSLHGFWVEVWYHPVMNSIDKIEVMESNKTLNLYLSDIDIISLMNKK